MKKIVIIGPESTGKSTLCAQLALHYGTGWCPEYAREYLLANGAEYTYDDLLEIAKGQVRLEDQFMLAMKEIEDRSGQAPVFIDTDMYVMKVWCEFVFGKCHRFILDEIVRREYDLYLLCDTDLPWSDDILREYPDIESRQKLFHIYEDNLMNQATPWRIVRGTEEERLKFAIDCVDAFLKSNI